MKCIVLYKRYMVSKYRICTRSYVNFLFKGVTRIHLHQILQVHQSVLFHFSVLPENIPFSQLPALSCPSHHRTNCRFHYQSQYYTVTGTALNTLNTLNISKSFSKYHKIFFHSYFL